MTRFPRFASVAVAARPIPQLAALLWLLLAACAGAGETDGVRVHEGACSMTSARGEALFAGDCVITRRLETRDVEGERCDYLRYEVLFPGIGLAVVHRGQDIVCPPRFQDEDAAFLARDKRGRLVLATAKGAILRFDPGESDHAPPPPLPVLDAFLSGIEACSFTTAHRTFTQGLWDAFPIRADDPDGLRTLAGSAAALPWPPGNPLSEPPLRSRKIGRLQQIDVPLRGSYLGLGLVGLRLEAEIGTSVFREIFVFSDPRATVARKFDASVRGARALAAPLRPELPAGEPGRLICDTAR